MKKSRPLKLESKGCLFIRHGANHDWYQNSIITIPSKISQPVPRHREIKEYLAKHILKKLS